MGEIGYGLTAELWWHPTFPYKSSLTGRDPQQFADELDDERQKQWTQPLMHYMVFEIVADAMKRTKNIDVQGTPSSTALKATNLDTLAGNINFSSGGAIQSGPQRWPTPLAGGQWIKGTKYLFDL